jgi:hypothetical protein
VGQGGNPAIAAHVGQECFEAEIVDLVQDIGLGRLVER